MDYIVYLYSVKFIQKSKKLTSLCFLCIRCFLKQSHCFVDRVGVFGLLFIIQRSFPVFGAICTKIHHSPLKQVFDAEVALLRSAVLPGSPMASDQ